MRKHRRRAVAELIVELAPDQQHDVGIRYGGSPHGPDHRRMIGGNQSAALLGVEIKGAAGVEDARELGAGISGASPGDDQGAPAPW